MANKYFAIFTDLGRKKIAEAAKNKTTVKFEKIAFGDGGGQYIEPKPENIKLYNEKFRTNVSEIRVNPKKLSQISIDGIIPKDIGGWYIREVGVFDVDGDMIIFANVPEYYKPKPEEGSAGDCVIQVIAANENVNVIVLYIDPSTSTWVPKQESCGFYYPVIPYLENAIVTDSSTGKQYRSKQSNNLGHPLSDTAWWDCKDTPKNLVYSKDFTNSDLNAGRFYFTHNLNEQKKLVITVTDSSNNICLPDIKFSDANSTILDFSNKLPLIGTYNVTVYATMLSTGQEPPPPNDDIAVYRKFFTASDLINGKLDVLHGLGNREDLVFTVRDYEYKIVEPDIELVSANEAILDFSKLPQLLGTYKVVIIRFNNK